ncbi:hypothetical protein N9D80_02805 [Flavobacteriales bacterium]|jgi:hypothetical protein|nr:hypothetical protein [Flavobacteriales bacterium]MDB0027468.1 hypothetical protein [Flavobacteriales bacterium]
MDKEKLIKGGMWLSGFSLSIMLSAMSLFAGFNNIRFGSYTMLIIGLLLIPAIFFFAYKGFGLILSAIFKEEN